MEASLTSEKLARFHILSFSRDVEIITALTVGVLYDN